MPNMTPRVKFINDADFEHAKAFLWDIAQQAMSHDPDHAKDLRRQERWINRLFGRVIKLENAAKELKQLKRELKETQKNLLADIIYNHNHAVAMIDRKIKEHAEKSIKDTIKE